jgi:DNA-binding response OmpR family regulator
MAQGYPANVDIVYAEPVKVLRNDLRTAIAETGFRGVRECADIGAVDGAIRLASPDILIFDTDMEKGKMLSLIQRLRHNKFGKNPFLSVIATCAEPNQRKIQIIADSGIDYIMVKPFAPRQLVQRFESIAKSRKPFAITSSYIGPDRRDLIKPREGDEDVKLVEVPNTIGMKARGERIDFYELQKAISGVMSDISDVRLKQNARRVAFLAGRMIEDITLKRFGSRISADAARIIEICGDTLDRLPESEMFHVVELCGSVKHLTRTIAQNLDTVTEKELILLKSVADAVLFCFNTEADSAEFAHQVMGLVTRAVGAPA